MLGHVVWIGMVREGLWFEGGIVPRFGFRRIDGAGTAQGLSEGR